MNFDFSRRSKLNLLARFVYRRFIYEDKYIYKTTSHGITLPFACDQLIKRIDMYLFTLIPCDTHSCLHHINAIKYTHFLDDFKRAFQLEQFTRKTRKKEIIIITSFSFFD